MTFHAGAVPQPGDKLMVYYSKPSSDTVSRSANRAEPTTPIQTGPEAKLRHDQVALSLAGLQPSDSAGGVTRSVSATRTESPTRRAIMDKQLSGTAGDGTTHPNGNHRAIGPEWPSRGPSQASRVGGLIEARQRSLALPEHDEDKPEDSGAGGRPSSFSDLLDRRWRQVQP